MTPRQKQRFAGVLAGLFVCTLTAIVVSVPGTRLIPHAEADTSARVCCRPNIDHQGHVTCRYTQPDSRGGKMCIYEASCSNGVLQYEGQDCLMRATETDPPTTPEPDGEYYGCSAVQGKTFVCVPKPTSPHPLDQ